MTDEEFQGYLSGGIELKGQRITGRVLLTGPRHPNGTHTDSPFVVQINNGDELSIRFAPGEDLESRLAKLSLALDRWLVLRPSNPVVNPPTEPAEGS